MLKKITKWETEDGEVFDTQEEAEEYMFEKEKETMTHHTDADAELLPCPFCGAGVTSIRENGKVWTGQRYSEPTSVSVQHHCEPIDGQPSRMIERVGRNLAGAISAWNSRAPAAPVPQEGGAHEHA